MILIADSGSTKISWTLLEDNGNVFKRWTTIGLNPYQQDAAQITTQLSEEFSSNTTQIKKIYFYGAGANKAGSKKLYQSFELIFKTTQLIDIQGDIMAAARALCKSRAGIACILGTGSNSCEYDGIQVVENVGGFGFILGDEGSGAVIGKQLMHDYLHRNIPFHIQEKLEATYDLSPTKVLEKVYSQAFPNRFLASFAPFLHENKQEGYVEILIKTQFNAFFKEKVLCYENAWHYPIHFTGSIAYHFQDLLKVAAQKYNLNIGEIVKAPMQGLIEYHQQKIHSS